MKRQVFIVLALATLALAQAYPSQDQTQKTNFRGATWGMTLEAVKKIEGNEPKQKSKSPAGLDIIAYMGKAGNLDCAYAYCFAADKLVQGRYVFASKHTNKNDYINDFHTVKESLTEKYGKPKEDQTYWSNNLYKDDPSEWGMAVAVGHLKFEVTWVLNDTEIFLQLSGDNYSIRHGVQYTSTIPEHVDLMKKAADEAKKGIW